MRQPGQATSVVRRSLLASGPILIDSLAVDPVSDACGDVERQGSNVVVLPFAGAVAAYWSRRMKGSVVERILSALFPVFTFAALFAVRIVYGLFFERVPYTLPHFLLGLFMTLIFIIVGGLFLVLGAWPFCRNGKFKPSDSSH